MIQRPSSGPVRHRGCRDRADLRTRWMLPDSHVPRLSITDQLLGRCDVYRDGQGSANGCRIGSGRPTRTGPFIPFRTIISETAAKSVGNWPMCSSSASNPPADYDDGASFALHSKVCCLSRVEVIDLDCCGLSPHRILDVSSDRPIVAGNAPRWAPKWRECASRRGLA
jgi:hypothetical protein